MTFLAFDKENIMTKALKMINICIYIVWEKGHWETGHFQNVSGEKGPLILWDSGHSPWETGHGKRDTLSSGIRDILWETGNAILWESDHLFSGKSGIWEMRYTEKESPILVISLLNHLCSSECSLQPGNIDLY